MDFCGTFILTMFGADFFSLVQTKIAGVKGSFGRDPEQRLNRGGFSPAKSWLASLKGVKTPFLDGSDFQTNYRKLRHAIIIQ